MQTLLWTMLLTVDPATAMPQTTETFSSAQSAAAVLDDRLPTGSLLFSRGECAAVKAFTDSPYTHVAAAVRDGAGQVWIYDSQNGVGVRKQRLESYLTVAQPEELSLLVPSRPFDREAAVSFITRLDAEQGRPYSVTHHLTGRRNEGLHCAEYLTDALIAAQLIKAQCPPRVSPASLRNGLLRHDLYRQDMAVLILVPFADRAPGRNWCEELWLDTKDCCANCWSKFRRCALCR